MKKRKMIVWALALFMCIIFLSGIATLQMKAYVDPGDGNWKDVCCGSTCAGGDYCTGSGTYTCCK